MRILISTGATVEPIDQVRFLSNFSSGSMGHQIASQAAIAGHTVTLLHSSTSISPPKHPRISAIPFTTTRDLQAKLQESWQSNDLLIMVAAVSDFTPRGGQSDQKLKRDSTFMPTFVPTTDLVAEAVKSKRTKQRVIAFTLSDESELEESATKKLQEKGVDAIIANPLQTMNSDVIDGAIYRRNGPSISPHESLSKPAFAAWFVNQLPSLFAST